MNRSVKLHIGCGKRYLKGYINIDKYPVDTADLIAPAHQLPYEDGTVDEIYTSHMIEHLPPDEFAAALAEWYRVLKMNGTLTIRCPNFELYVREWLLADYDYRWGWGIRNLLGWQDRGGGMLNRNGFSVRRLTNLLTAAGFLVRACYTTRTRARRGVEFRENGDIYCEATKSAVR
jgi:SAM-dependent methyltransferase